MVEIGALASHPDPPLDPPSKGNRLTMLVQRIKGWKGNNRSETEFGGRPNGLFLIVRRRFTLREWSEGLELTILTPKQPSFGWVASTRRACLKATSESAGPAGGGSQSGSDLGPCAGSSGSGPVGAQRWSARTNG